MASIRPTAPVARPSKPDNERAKQEERNDFIDDTVLRRMQADLEQVSLSFQRGEMQAFGKQSKDIFKSLDVIRDMQERLVAQHISVELQPSSEARPTPENMGEFLTMQTEQERKLGVVLDNLGLLKSEMEKLQANFVNLE
ncbi:hypothetical protein CAOG_08799 [Capsaspora owczarzaki ATCC 30864]|uniref:Uncharacterized protein n=1 Tax=Capsaspora owczarzaki (strain ATCC 30864) TaxID=595528 RepID=A0A0D2VS80_CAPO3|nr:hypothetical protein CAOG_08799 [Capsaspora owczarzaki ATCC 30864]KJE93907.1 hypothetical protein CAOG_008799 [Capsaspora owczarzaki ATCC 30864]|eukprot:XP_011270439.1 hypothetical protein CAOG_08799 [Capsaspora owczarzaki ATCC 30864]